MLFYNLTIFILINAGVSVGISRSSLTLPFREKITLLGKKNVYLYWFGLLINCPLCIGFYTSIPVYFFVYNTFGLTPMLFAFMFIGSFTSYFLYKLSNFG